MRMLLPRQNECNFVFMIRRYDYSELLQFCRSVFSAIGCSENHAKIASENLLSADLRGVDSHGVARLTGYIRLWEAGRVKVNPNLKIIHQTASTALVDGDSGLGLVVAPYAMQTAIEKAKISGTGWVAVQNSNHFGIAGKYAMMALNHDMIGIAMTNASALVAPTFSREKLLGTNPMAFAIPAGSEMPFVADFATTTAANGKLEIAQRKKEKIPLGWVQDEKGAQSDDADILKKGGALLPLGSDRSHSSHKGYMLGSIVDILSGVLGGANFGPWVPPFPAYVPMPENMPGEGVGHFFGAMRIDAFQSAETFKRNMDQWIKRFRNAKPIDENQPVIVPGDPERDFELDRMRNGISLHPEIISGLQKLAEDYKIKGL